MSKHDYGYPNPDDMTPEVQAFLDEDMQMDQLRRLKHDEVVAKALRYWRELRALKAGELVSLKDVEAAFKAWLTDANSEIAASKFPVASIDKALAWATISARLQPKEANKG